MRNDELDSPDKSPMVYDFLNSPDDTNGNGGPNDRGHGEWVPWSLIILINTAGSRRYKSDFYT